VSPAASPKTQTKKIGEHVYSVTMLDAWTSWELLGNLIKQLGPAIVRGLLAVPELAPKMHKAGSTDVDLDGVNSAVLTFADRLSLPEMRAIIEQLFTTVTVNNVSLNDIAAAHFQGDLPGMMKVALFAAKVNWGNFTLVDRGLAALAAAKKPANPSPASATTSKNSGPSGVSGTPA
jgi:hypothetical protein